MSTIWLVLALAAQFNWKVHQMDVKSAFLNGDLQEEVYLMQPPGFKVAGQEKKFSTFDPWDQTRFVQHLFDMTDLGLHYCLGVEVWQTENNIFLSQSKYAKNLVDRFRMQDCKPATTPTEPRLKLLAHSDPILSGYTDSDWAGSVDDRKSTVGYVFSLGSSTIT
eukprot:PITA_02611